MNVGVIVLIVHGKSVRGQNIKVFREEVLNDLNETMCIIIIQNN